MLYHFCHLNNIIPEPGRQFNRTSLVLFSPPNPTETVFQSIKLCITFIQHSFTACILNLTLVLWGSQSNCQKSFHLSPLTTIRQMELHVSMIGLSFHLTKHKALKDTHFRFTNILARTLSQQFVITVWDIISFLKWSRDFSSPLANHMNILIKPRDDG